MSAAAPPPRRSTKMDLSNKTIVISGANRGIGKELVNALLTRGVKKIYAGARNPGRLPKLGDARVVPLELDITNHQQVKAAATQAKDADLLINNAGVAAFASLLGDEESVLERDMNTNYFGTLDMMRVFIPVLEGKPEAAIVNIVTVAAFVNFPGLGGYSASKAALFSASQGIRIELAPRGISVHTVNPGPIDTDMTKALEMAKASPKETARRILDGLVAGEADIFPDDAGSQMFGVWKQDYRQLEQMIHNMHHGIGS